MENPHPLGEDVRFFCGMVEITIRYSSEGNVMIFLPEKEKRTSHRAAIQILIGAFIGVAVALILKSLVPAVALGLLFGLSIHSE